MDLRRFSIFEREARKYEKKKSAKTQQKISKKIKIFFKKGLTNGRVCDIIFKRW
jgi:hypothetical protein